MERPNGSTWRTIGAASAIYLALSYAVGMAIFLIALRYTEIPDLAGRLAVVVENSSLVFATNLMMYILFGPALIGLALAIRNEASVGNAAAGRAPVDLAAVIGAVWAGSLVASGMVANAAIEPAMELYAKNRAEAEAYWRAIETVTIGLGNGNGEILGSLFTFFVSLAALRGNFLSRPVAILGFAACVPGFLSVLPTLHDLSGLFGILQLIWFALIAASLLKSKRLGAITSPRRS